MAAEILDRRRALGQYYTPANVADAVVGWAVQNRFGRVLDPSFGGCSFLRECLKRFRGMGHQQPGQLVYGIDIDPDVVANARELRSYGLDSSHIIIDDFLGVSPRRFAVKFNAIVGNPPYIRHHRLGPESKRRGHELGSRLSLTKRADLWAYFLVHSLGFLRDEGRLAYLLPAAALHSDYATQVLGLVAPRFGSVTLVRLRRRIFEATQEVTVLLLADSLGRQHEGVFFAEAEDESELTSLLAGQLEAARVPLGSRSSVQHLRLSASVVNLLRALSLNPDVRKMDDLARVRLGVVTGANRFFVRRKSELRGLRGSRSTRVLARSSVLRGATWTRADDVELDRADVPSHLLSISSRRPSPQVKALIAEGEAAGLHARYKCRLREPWYSLTDLRSPDAFLPYMSADHPTLILNKSAATCTNCIHRVWWKKSDLPASNIVAGSWTSLFALSAELEGRSYGGGVLKLEPSEAVRCLVPTPSISDRVIGHIDEAARRYGRQRGRDVADRFILRDGLGLNTAQVAELSHAARELAQARVPDG